MAVIKVALLQMTSCGNDRDANRAKGAEFCHHASEMGADIALFPEMWSIGYTLLSPDSFYDPAQESARKTWEDQAIGQDDDFVMSFRELARELKMTIALTYLERWPGAPRNSVSIIDQRGEIAMTYAKVHTCDFSPEAACTPGDDFYVCSLNTDEGEVKIGAMICYDREFPESARILMLKGAELILTPNACNLGMHRIGQFRARAYENMLGVAMTNYADPQNNGHSVAFDGITFDDNGMRDDLVVEAGKSEGIYMAKFDLDRMRASRECGAWGNAFRKPHRYGLLTSMKVEEPFIRESARR